MCLFLSFFYFYSYILLFSHIFLHHILIDSWTHGIDWIHCTRLCKNQYIYNGSIRPIGYSYPSMANKLRTWTFHSQTLILFYFSFPGRSWPFSWHMSSSLVQLSFPVFFSFKMHTSIKLFPLTCQTYPINYVDYIILFVLFVCQHRFGSIAPAGYSTSRTSRSTISFRSQQANGIGKNKNNQK